ncbi:hypothetical protein DYQ86_12635 [Acidobacteria bacterium AB60]|nr:hypothetical protein DYQ86_12635 [Acidobacteria bacterium AB60]
MAILERMRRLAVWLFVASMSVGLAAQNAPGPAEISADLGPCSALLTVTDAAGKPVYGAKMTARVQYGFAGVKKLDLEAFTGQDGKVKIAKLPETLKKPMIIHVGKDEKADQVEFKPSVQCHATFDVQLK